MNVASLELSRELYELSGWDDTEGVWANARQEQPDYATSSVFKKGEHPAYELGYLLRKLPSPEQYMKLVVDVISVSGKRVYYVQWRWGQVLTERHDTPEDAVVAFYIELFKQGVLTRGGDE